MDDVVEARFWSRVRKSAGCWEWDGSHTTAGYGNMNVGNGRYDYTHRIMLRLNGIDLPKGMHVDHLCRNRGCCNPDHLEVVTPSVNFLRGARAYGALRTECFHGHDITDSANVYVTPKGAKRCRACARDINDRRRLERQARGDLRKVLLTQCKRGHPFDETNTYIAPRTGQRHCRKCSAIRATGYREAKR